MISLHCTAQTLPRVFFSSKEDVNPSTTLGCLVANWPSYCSQLFIKIIKNVYPWPPTLPFVILFAVYLSVSRPPWAWSCTVHPYGLFVWMACDLQTISPWNASLLLLKLCLPKLLQCKTRKSLPYQSPTPRRWPRGHSRTSAFVGHVLMQQAPWRHALHPRWLKAKNLKKSKFGIIRYDYSKQRSNTAARLMTLVFGIF